MEVNDELHMLAALPSTSIRQNWLSPTTGLDTVEKRKKLYLWQDSILIVWSSSL
jgi:hypothetical protein